MTQRKSPESEYPVDCSVVGPRGTHNQWTRAAGTLLILTGLLAWTGCSTETAELRELRERFVLESEPGSATTIADAKAAVQENSQVVFAGRITGVEQEVFSPGEASFVLTEILPDEEGHGGEDHADNCPFCKRKAEQAPRASVQFVDAAGQTFPIDARELFEIGPGDTVVIRGTGELMAEMDLFLVTADGIHVRRSEGG
jgi:hypothetical protein